MSTDFNKPEQNILSIRLGTDGFSFSVSSPLVAEGLPSIPAYKTDGTLPLAANLKRALRETEGLALPYRRVNVLVPGKRFVTVPMELFEDEQVETVFYHNHARQENETVLYNILPRNNIVVLFSMDQSACRLLQDHYPAVRFYSQTSPLIEYFAGKSRLGNCRKLYANLRKGAADLYGYERGHLLVANSFPCDAVSDRIYYLLYAWKQLGFDQERDELHLCGQLDDKHDLLPGLRKYLRHVFIMTPSDNLDFKAITSCE